MPHELLLPSCEKGIGKLIHSPSSPDLIEGVKIQPYSLWPNDRGYFLEVLRIGKGLAADFPPESTQVSAALVVLRKVSPTQGLRYTMYVGALRPRQILIPPGAGNLYKVVGPDAGVLVSVTNRLYDPARRRPHRLQRTGHSLRLGTAA